MVMIPGEVQEKDAEKKRRLKDILSQLCIFTSNLGHFNQAKFLATVYRELEPEDEGPVIAEAYTLMAQNKPNKAAQILIAAIGNQPSSVNGKDVKLGALHSFLGLALIMAKQTKRAETLLRLVAENGEETAAQMAQSMIDGLVERPVENIPLSMLT